MGTKLYRVRNDREGLRRVRDGKETVVKFVDAEGWYCTSDTDMKDIAIKLKALQEFSP